MRRTAHGPGEHPALLAEICRDGLSDALDTVAMEVLAEAPCGLRHVSRLSEHRRALRSDAGTWRSRSSRSVGLAPVLDSGRLDRHEQDSRASSTGGGDLGRLAEARLARVLSRETVLLRHSPSLQATAQGCSAALSSSHHGSRFCRDERTKTNVPGRRIRENVRETVSLSGVGEPVSLHSRCNCSRLERSSCR